MSERARKLVQLAREKMNEKIDEVNCSSASNNHEMPALSTQVTNQPSTSHHDPPAPSTSHHDQSNGMLCSQLRQLCA